MDSPMATRPPPNDRSAGEDSNGGAFFPFWSLEVHVLDFKAYGFPFWSLKVHVLDFKAYGFPFRSLEVHVLYFKAYGGAGTREQNFRSTHRSVAMHATSNGGFFAAIK